jgi:hypothetical protein
MAKIKLGFSQRVLLKGLFKIGYRKLQKIVHSPRTRNSGNVTTCGWKGLEKG